MKKPNYSDIRSEMLKLWDIASSENDYKESMKLEFIERALDRIKRNEMEYI